MNWREISLRANPTSVWQPSLTKGHNACGKPPYCDSLPAYLVHWAEQIPSAAALLVARNDLRPPLVLSYRQFAEKVCEMAHHLARHGIERGDRIAILVNRDERMFIALLAASSLGAVPVPIVVPSPACEDALKMYHAHFPIKLVLHSGRFGNFIAKVFAHHAPPRVLTLEHAISVSTPSEEAWEAWLAWVDLLKSSDVCYVNHTSGSTSQPKLVEATHGQLLANARSCVEYFRMDSATRMLCTFAYHQHEHFLRPLLLGGCAVLAPFDPLNNSMASMCKDATHLMLNSHAMAALCAESPERLRLLRGKLKVIEIGGSLVSNTSCRFLESETGAHVFVAYGSTETSGVALATPWSRSTDWNALDLLPGYEARVSNERRRKVADETKGELVIEGEAVATHYIVTPPGEIRLENGCFFTKDLAVRLDKRFHVLGRLDCCIKMLGSRQSLEPIELELRRVFGKSVNAVQCLKVEPQGLAAKFGMEGSLLAVVSLESEIEASYATQVQMVRAAICKAKLQAFLTTPTHVLIAWKDEIGFNEGKLQRRIAVERFISDLSQWPREDQRRLIRIPIFPFHVLRSIIRLWKMKRALPRPFHALGNICNRLVRSISTRLNFV
jgi:long-chain acyl-CoA synthetase